MNASFHKLMLIAALATTGPSNLCAQSTTDAKPKQAATDKASNSNGASAAPTVNESEKPTASPGWVVLEEDWWLPFQYDYSMALHSALVHYRSGRARAAAAEIEKARSWIKYAQNHADKATQEDLSTASSDLEDYALQLKSGIGVKAIQLEAAFAGASAALAKYHHFLSSKALATGDLTTAGQHLKAAVEHLREAASAANYEYGDDIGTIYHRYWPFGHWDETVGLERSGLEESLQVVENELAKLTRELKQPL